MTQEVLKLSQEALAGLKDVEKQVRELVAENRALKEALAKEKTLQALHTENERLGLYKDAYAEQEQERPCRSCNGTGERYTGIDESPIAMCKPCTGTGLIAAHSQRKPPTVDVRILQAVSDEYNAWIRAHASGMGYDDFLLQRLAAHDIKENT